MRSILLPLLLLACSSGGSTIDVPGDKDTSLDSDSDSGPDSDTDPIVDDTYDSDPVDTDPVDTSPPLTTYVISGKALCVEGFDDQNQIQYGDPAQPRNVRVIPGPGMFCKPLGGGCSYTGDYLTVIAEDDVDTDGSFSITIERENLDDLWLFSDTTDMDLVGNCGSGIQYTEAKLTDLEAEGALTDLTLDVYSVFY